MWVKICGNTNLDDALRAAKLGADALGFIFARSPRQLTPAQAAAITAKLPAGVERVGVFDSHDAAEIAGIAHEAAMTAVQLHGGFDEELLARMIALESDRLVVIQTLHWAAGQASVSSEDQAGKLRAELARVAQLSARAPDRVRVLLDSKVGSASGGTGAAFDWAAAAEVLASISGQLPVIAAGGLRPENVAEAISRLEAWGVDVASGVESSPGRKDPARLAAFLAKARG